MGEKAVLMEEIFHVDDKISERDAANQQSKHDDIEELASTHASIETSTGVRKFKL
jgi:hypothetical protein